jgi:hypothetical protein
MCVGDGAHDRQSQAGASVAAGTPGVWAREALEGVWQVFCRETGTGIGDLDYQVRASGPGRDHDRRSCRREPQGVIDQVIDRFADAIGV